jgi:23S rRNA G2445 N2-methylase RlmL
MKYIAYTTKGLEQISKEEISCKLNAIIAEVGDKRVVFETDKLANYLTELKTVDDIGILVGKLENATSLVDIIEFMKALDLNTIQNQLKYFRPIANNFSLTAGLVGIKSFTASDLTQALAPALSEKYNWTYTEFDHSNRDIRIFGDTKAVYFSMRLTKDSLHHRSYKTVAKPGSLKPTVAASMLYLTTNEKQNLQIVDNFCGSGTILCEAVLAGHRVYGGDTDNESVEITKRNLSNLKQPAPDTIKNLDATQTNWPTAYFDCAVSNLPWDKQIEVKSITALYEGTIKEYARLVKPTGSLCLLLTKPELMIKYAKMYLPSATVKTYKIGLLGQTPTIVLVKRI